MMSKPKKKCENCEGTGKATAQDVPYIYDQGRAIIREDQREKVKTPWKLINCPVCNGTGEVDG